MFSSPYQRDFVLGWSKYSVAYHSDGFKSHNYPFTASSYGPPLAQGDVLGIGYRPRTGTVFFTRNGRKHEDAFVGLNRFNLFPAVGASGPAVVHVNLGQAGFVFIEANVKKWGLAPSVGTLAPPPAYGSERGSILLEAGFGASGGTGGGTANGRGLGDSVGSSRNSPIPDRHARGDERGVGSVGSYMSGSSVASSSNSNAHAGRSSRHKHRSRRPHPPSASTTPIRPSPLRVGGIPTPNSPTSPSQPGHQPRSSRSSNEHALTPPSDLASPYVSPVDRDAAPRITHRPPTISPSSSEDDTDDKRHQDEDEGDGSYQDESDDEDGHDDPGRTGGRTSSSAVDDSTSSPVHLLRQLSSSPSDDHISPFNNPRLPTFEISRSNHFISTLR